MNDPREAAASRIHPRKRAARKLTGSTYRSGRAVSIIVAIAIATIFAGYDVAGIADLHNDPVTGVDYLPVVEFVAERKLPGEKVLVALPPPAYLALGSTDDLIFLSSPIHRKRAQRYTRLTADGGYVDYWAGVDSVVDTASLCNTLLSEPGLWLIVDDSRLNADWAFLGTMAEVIRGLTYVRLEVEGGAMVRRLAPPPSRDPAAEAICAAAQTGRVQDVEKLLPPAEPDEPPSQD